MNEEEKRIKLAAKKKLKNTVAPRVQKLYVAKEYGQCLDLINGLQGSVAQYAMSNYYIYSFRIASLTNTGSYQDALTLINDCTLFGHTKEDHSILVRYCEAVCNYKVLNPEDSEENLRVLKLFEAIELHHLEVDMHNIATDCTNELRVRCEEVLKKEANDRMEKLVKAEEDVKAEEEVKKLEANKSKNSGKKAEVTVQNDDELDEPPSSLSVHVDPSESNLIAGESESSTDLSLKTPRTIVFSRNMSFEMDMLDENCYGGEVIYEGFIFRKSFIVPNANQLKHLVDPTPIETNTSRFLLKTEFLVSSSLSCNLSVVEEVCPIVHFFKQKLSDFKKKPSASVSNRKEEWWKSISDCFHRIFCGILCGLFAIHSEQRICGDLDNSLYVTNDGEGKIFYVRGEEYSATGAQTDLDSLLSVMENIVVLIEPRIRRKSEIWKKEFEEEYKLPNHLVHFFMTLRYQKVADYSIHTKWTIYHPWCWPVGHGPRIIEILIEVFKEGLIDEIEFMVHFRRFPIFLSWKQRVCKNSLMQEIYEYKGDQVYKQGMHSEVLRFLHSFLAHANDKKYDSFRGSIKLTPTDFEKQIEAAFPEFYTLLYEIFHLHSNKISHELPSFLKALKRCYSCDNRIW